MTRDWGVLEGSVDTYIKPVYFKVHPHICRDKILNSLWIIFKLRWFTIFAFPQLWLKFEKDWSITKKVKFVLSKWWFQDRIHQLLVISQLNPCYIYKILTFLFVVRFKFLFETYWVNMKLDNIQDVMKKFLKILSRDEL